MLVFNNIIVYCVVKGWPWQYVTLSDMHSYNNVAVNDSD